MKTLMIPEVGDVLDNVVVLKVIRPFIAGLLSDTAGHTFVTYFVSPSAELAAGHTFDDVEDALEDLSERGHAYPFSGE